MASDVERKHTCGGSKGNARILRKITPVSLRCSLPMFPLILNGRDDGKGSSKNQHLTVRRIKINITFNKTDGWFRLRITASCGIL